ncbi:cytochrome P450 705A22-like [Durio zibethinus]|uniref:Cytochrome P450 705A22-like n=1 Tax=Durio zibethinus TaxID=66656 RepID=A0A6P5XGW5_DURZI|nr:cytochrome P450 705A22-like [Durio zibethinus]
MRSISEIKNYMLWFLLLWIFSAFLIRFIFNKPRKSSAILHLPPSPPSLPIIGHLHHLRPLLLHKSFHNLFCEYGPLLYLRFGSYPCLLVSSPSVAEEIFKNQDANFASRPISPLDDCLIFGNTGFVTAPYGDYWRFMKKLSVTELLGTQQIERSRTVRHQETARFLSKMIQSARKTEVVDVGAELMKLTNNIICRVVASTSCSDEDDEAKRIRELLKMSCELAGKMSFANSLGPFKKLGFWLYAKKSKDVTARYDQLMEKLLRKHEDKAKNNGSDDNKDFMDILLKVCHDDTAELRITREQMKSFIADLFFSGTSTTAETMQWAMAELINNPSVYKIARDEIESVVGRNRLVKETDIRSLHYVQAITKETLRLYPNAPFAPRVCIKDCKINGFDIPQNTPVAVNLYSIMRDPTIWEKPNEFCPERFLDLATSKIETKGQNFDFIPFGGGRRGCPGKNLAYILMNTAIASVIQCLDLKVIGEDGDSAKVNMQEAIGMSLAMASPLQCLPLVHFDPFC